MTTVKKKIVVIGGGTGTYTALRGLKAYADMIDISAVVTMADSGGSTGRLRDEFGQLPVGDVRMALSALATEVGDHAGILRELFLYRFSKGEGLLGHNFGNLLLTALTDIVGSTSSAIETASQILRVQGSVIPVTSDDVQLVATYNSGRTVVGEHEIDVSSPESHFDQISNLAVVPDATINPKAAAALAAADLVVLGPGDIFTSILANCVVGGMPASLQHTKARVVFVCNVMSRSGQTIGLHSRDYLDAIEKYVGRRPDYMLYHNTVLSESLLANYRAEGNHLVENNCCNDTCQVVMGDVVSTDGYVSVVGDTLPRSLIRHDAKKLAAAIIKLL